MTLIDDFRRVYLRLRSVQCWIIAAICTGVEAVLPFFDYAFPRGIFAILSFAAAVAGLISRAVAQKALYGEPKE